jgi:hypothetical protein
MLSMARNELCGVGLMRRRDYAFERYCAEIVDRRAARAARNRKETLRASIVTFIALAGYYVWLIWRI